MCCIRGVWYMWCSSAWYEKTCCSPPAPRSIFVEGGADLLSIFVPRVNTGWQSLRTSEVFVFFRKYSHRPLCRSLTNTCGNTWVRLIGCPDMGCGLRGLLRGPSSPLHLPLASLPGSTSTGPPTQRYQRQFKRHNATYFYDDEEYFYIDCPQIVTTKTS